MNLTLLSLYTTKLYSDEIKAVEAGMNSILEWYSTSLKAFDAASVREGVCAKVSIVIKQDLVLTREGFVAELKIANGEDAALTKINISLVIKYRDLNDSSWKDATQLFSVSNASMDENIYGGIGGNGRVESQREATIKWTLIAYKEATNSSSSVVYWVSHEWFML